jgi:RNA polymerase sigma-70 factor, ECF subfamily
MGLRRRGSRQPWGGFVPSLIASIGFRLAFSNDSASGHVPDVADDPSVDETVEAEQPSVFDAEISSLIQEQADGVYRIARSIVRDPMLAEDVTQETLIKVWRALPAFRGDASLRSWVMRIAHNTSVSALRSEREEPREPGSMPDKPASHTVEQTVHNQLAVEDLWKALEKLDPVTRSVVVLREIEGLSYEDIARVLLMSVPTVKTRLFRGRRSLAAALREWRA